VQVENDQIRLGPNEDLGNSRGVALGDHVPASAALEHASQEPQIDVLVVDSENPQPRQAFIKSHQPSAPLTA
jgi:hypothetical protein